MQRTCDTSPEIALRQALHARRVRFRLHVPVPGMPRRKIDIAMTRRRIAVMVDGCFWHACPQHATHPQRNSAWWARKLADNVRRDRETTARLESAGWTVIRVWEHEDPEEAAERIIELAGIGSHRREMSR